LTTVPAVEFQEDYMQFDRIGVPTPPAESVAAMTGLLERLIVAVDDLRASVQGRRKELYTVVEVAGLTGRAPFTVRRWIAEGRLAAIRVEGTGPRGRLLIPGDQLARLLPQGLGGALPAVTSDRADRDGGDGV
jgi:excisionase family DNA binding protein